MLGWMPIPVPRTHSLTPMDNASSSRQMRNEAEKKRRDTLNGYITELGRLVPTVDSTPRRIDKISILRLAAAYLQQNQILQSGRVPERPFLPITQTYNLSLSMVEDMDAFMLVVTSAGKIVFVSHTVEKLLGHAQIDLFGQSLYKFTLKEDHPVLAFNLQPDGGAESASKEEPDAGSGDDTSCSSDSSTSPAPAPAPATILAVPAAPPETQRRSFFLQLSQRCASRSEQPEYKRVHVLGNLRVPRNTAARRHTRKQSGECLGGEGGSTNESVLVAMVRLESRIRELSLLEANKDEYVTRHLIDGRIIYSDHRISLVAGYLTEEVNGMSAFKFMHQEDVMFTIVALRQMYDRGEGFGCSCYRLQSKTGQFIYLRTHGFLEKNDETNEVESFICINTLVPEEDGKRLIQEMKTRYSANFDPARQIGAIMEPEGKLEEAISQLIPATVEPPSIHSPFPDTQYMKAVLSGKALPPPSVHTARAGLGSPKSDPNLGSPGSGRPSVGSPGGNGRVARSPELSEQRPSVITSGLRRRRHDSDTVGSAKRRRSPPHPGEQLSVQVPPRLSPEELSRAILSRGGDSLRGDSPPVKTRRYTHTSDLPLSFLSREAPPTPPCKTELLSPNQESYDSILSPFGTTSANLTSPGHPYDNGGFLSPSQSSFTNTTDALLSPNQALHTNTNRHVLLSPGKSTYTNTTETLSSPSQALHTNRDILLSPSQALYSSQVLYTNQDDLLLPIKEAPLRPTQDAHCPEAVPYPSKAVSNTNRANFRTQVLLAPGTAEDESLYSLDVGSSYHNKYLESMLNQPDLIIEGMNQVEVPTCSDNRDSDPPLYLLEQSYSRLESNLQIQQMQITSIKEEIKQVPKPHSDQVFKNFSEIEDEHKQNQHLLHILKQDITRTCT